jgi:hypothetical protein
MEPLDPKLARIVHEGMVQAVPGAEVEQRVLQGLLARLPTAGPPGGEGVGDVIGDAAPAWGKAAAMTGGGGKTLLWVVALGVTAVAGAVWMGGAREAEPERAAVARAHAPSEPAAATPRGSMPSVSEPEPEPEPIPTKPDVPSTPSLNEPAMPASNNRPPAKAGASRRTPSEPAPSEPAAAPDELAAEIQQIAAADRALARGDARHALQLAREHATAHPHGQLGVERTAIELCARCELREPGASEAAATFLREHGDAPAAAKVRTRCATAKEPTSP